MSDLVFIAFDTEKKAEEGGTKCSACSANI